MPVALNQVEISRQLKDLPNWKQDGQTLVRVQTFPEYRAALDFVYQLGLAAEKADHHPDLTMNFKRVEVRFSTHSAGGITALDFQMAATADGLAGRFQRPQPQATA